MNGRKSKELRRKAEKQTEGLPYRVYVIEGVLGDCTRLQIKRWKKCYKWNKDRSYEKRLIPLRPAM